MKSFEIPGIIPLTKHRLTIDSGWVDYRGSRLQLYKVISIKAGIIRTRVNGISAGRTYKIILSDGASQIEVIFVDAFSPSSRERLFGELYQELVGNIADDVARNFVSKIINESPCYFAGCRAELDGIHLKRRTLNPFKQSEFKKFGWTEVRFWHESGDVILEPIKEEGFQTRFSLLESENACILEAIIKQILFYVAVEKRVAAASKSRLNIEQSREE